ncbi:GNAT family N-acetyltransferase [Caulobacter sp.]|uniref:GNAT family N-acetyltransferase n=1 Tax=Caulobacter sp. TaxID=78 RepID=UPI001B00105B|nr:GNAT family N-acetyltransferase [Caulobacter sp.]MBO9547646.1 GNAT family N-acetyltransferase [Caulobacter sp.]
MTVAIRPALASEIEAVRDIERASAQRFIGLMDALAADEPSPASVLSDRIATGGLLVAEIDGALAAFVMFRPVSDGLYIEQIDVLPAFERRRLGATLIDAVGERTRRLLLSTFRDVPWNAPYYRRLGFRDLDDQKLAPDLTEIRREHLARGLDESLRVFMERV